MYRHIIPDRYTHAKSQNNMKGADMKNELFSTKN